MLELLLGLPLTLLDAVVPARMFLSSSVFVAVEGDVVVFFEEGGDFLLERVGAIVFCPRYRQL